MQTVEEWNPGLNNDEKMLHEVLVTLPGYQPKEIHFMVRLLENPDSPMALKGAVSLPRHDAIHVLLGRGLLTQDEAFVIGFTMGTSKNISHLESWCYEKISKYLYPKEYRLNDDQIKVYELALSYGKSCGVKEIYAFPFERYNHYTLGELRHILNINKEELREIYREEQGLVPHTTESKRLLM